MAGATEDLRKYVSEYGKAQDELSNVEKQIEAIEKLKSSWEDAKNAYETSQNEARLSAYFGSDYELQLLNNSTTWREKFALDYADICDQIKAKEEEIAALSETTASDVASSAQQASDALNSAGQTLNGVRDAAAGGDSLSKYLWTSEDDAILEAAKEKLRELERLTGGEITDAKRKHNWSLQCGR